MDSTCRHCGGLIPEPNKAYGFAGKWCHCVRNPLADGELFRPSRLAEIDELRRRLARLEDAERREQERAWRQHQHERNGWLTSEQAKALVDKFGSTEMPSNQVW